MAAAQVAKKLKDKRQKKTFEGIFNKVVLNSTFLICPWASYLHNVKVFVGHISDIKFLCKKMRKSRQSKETYGRVLTDKCCILLNLGSLTAQTLRQKMAILFFCRFYSKLVHSEFHA